MKTKHCSLVGVVLLAGVAAISFGVGRTANMGDTVIEEWEYATYNHTRASDIGGRKGDMFSWISPDNDMRSKLSDDQRKLWQECGLSLEPDAPTSRSLWFSFLSKSGWELVCVEGREPVTSYWFRRLKK